MDFVTAASMLVFVAFFARDWVNPDGVAYLENAEAIARGRWTSAIQGYWSPGYSVLLAPLVRIAGEDRALLVRLAHLTQVATGICTLLLAVAATHRRVPAAMQRTAFWVTACVIIVWLSQELLTPDLALCACLLGVIILIDRDDPRAKVTAGILVSAGFLLKTSIWPWLVVACVFAALPAARTRRPHALPWRVLAPAVAIIGAWLVVLGGHTGRPTLGSIGPLNIAWYLGNTNRRTPDSDLGPHELYKQATLPGGTPITFTDLRGTDGTYLPWSNPELWSEGVPKASRPKLDLGQASRTWYDNFRFAIRVLLPALLGLTACAWFARVSDDHPASRRWQWDLPMLTTGLAALAAFIAVHPEQRLVAPGMILFAFGALFSAGHVRLSRGLRITTAALLATVALNIAIFLWPRRDILVRNAAIVHSERAYFDQRRASNPNPGAVIIGPAMPWMALLWVAHMHVAVQFGASAAASIQTLTAAQRAEWLRANFGDAASGYGEAIVNFDGNRVNTGRNFYPW